MKGNNIVYSYGKDIFQSGISLGKYKTPPHRGVLYCIDRKSFPFDFSGVMK